jgi:acyl carrier protein
MIDEQERELVEFIARQILRDPSLPLVPETGLFRERLLNSMNILDLVGYVEQRMGRRLQEHEIVMSNFESPRAIVKAFLSDEY